MARSWFWNEEQTGRIAGLLRCIKGGVQNRFCELTGPLLRN